MKAEVIRPRAQRGEGVRLRADILAAARALLERTRSEDAVTLRSIAREAGVTAPAIYAHFADRSAVVEAVIDEAFEQFAVAVTTPMQAVEDPVERLRAGCAGYVRYAHEFPGTYSILFTRQQPSAMPAVGASAAIVFQVMVDALADCPPAAGAQRDDPFLEATTLWLGVHGLAALPPCHPRFPWPDVTQLLDTLLSRHVQLRTS